MVQALLDEIAAAQVEKRHLRMPVDRGLRGVVAICLVAKSRTMGDIPK